MSGGGSCKCVVLTSLSRACVAVVCCRVLRVAAVASGIRVYIVCALVHQCVAVCCKCDAVLQ